MLIYSAIFLGLLGSFHCIGMCSPIALALPLQNTNKWTLLRSRLLYNFGRIVTYSLLGAVVGLMGRGITLTGTQQILSIVLGLLILTFLILPKKTSKSFSLIKPAQKFTAYLRKQFSKLFKKKTVSSYFLIGFVNGFLPCGLVYLALAGAIATGGFTDGILYMFLFGAGTLPIMLIISLSGNFIKPKLRTLIYKKMLPVFTFTLALLFIVRGLNLGIPYLSPKITKVGQDINVECCEIKE